MSEFRERVGVAPKTIKTFHCPFSYIESWLVLEAEEHEHGVALDWELQRGHRWTREQQIHYVENVVRGYVDVAGLTIRFNSPSWRVDRDPKSDLKDQVTCIDGLQRLSAVRAYINGEFTVFGLRPEDMPRRLILRDLEFVFQMYDFQTRKDVWGYYLAINAGGTPHSVEEIARVQEEYDRLCAESEQKDESVSCENEVPEPLTLFEVTDNVEPLTQNQSPVQINGDESIQDSQLVDTVLSPDLNDEVVEVSVDDRPPEVDPMAQRVAVESNPLLITPDWSLVKVVEGLNNIDVYSLYERWDSECVNCSSNKVVKNGYRDGEFIDMPVRGKHVKQFARTGRFRCVHCSANRLLARPGLHVDYRITHRLLNYIFDGLARKKSFVTLDAEVGLGSRTIASIVNRHVNSIGIEVRYDLPDALVLVSFNKTMLLVLDYETRELLDVLENFSNIQSFELYLMRFPNIRLIYMLDWGVHHQSIARVIPCVEIKPLVELPALN